MGLPEGAPGHPNPNPNPNPIPNPDPDPNPNQVRLGGWKYERIREDKKLPNDIKTVESIKV